MLYTVKIFKSWGARDAERRWSNTYELESDATSPDGLGDTVDALVAAEKIIHANIINFLSATVSTWEPDGTPYNPLSFTTIELEGTGLVNPVPPEDMLDSNVCLVLKYLPTLGRSGRRFYRGCLHEASVQSRGDGRFTIVEATGPGSMRAAVVAFKASIAPFLSGGAAGDEIVLAGSSGSTVERGVVDIQLGGVTVNKRNHRYFDRVSVGG